MKGQVVGFGKGQVKLQQMAFMLIALTIFFVLVGLFMASFSLSGIKDAREAAAEKNAMLLVSKLASSPEFSCERSFSKQMSFCVDLDKVMALKGFSEKYKDLCDVSNIEIQKIYPFSDIECTSGNYNECGHVGVLSSNTKGVDQSTFITLCWKEGYFGSYYNKCTIAKLIVRVSDEA